MKRKSVLRGNISIVGGKWRGRKLSICKSNNLRPTTNRIRKTLFDWLMPVIQQSRCLDCFAGSGSLAIHALSYNAAYATLIELKRHVIAQLMINLAKLEIKNAQVVNRNVLSYLTQVGSFYDIVFLDPPFRKNLLQRTAFLLEKNKWLSEDCRIYVESEVEADLTTLPKNWYLQHRKIAGQVAYHLYIRNK